MARDYCEDARWGPRTAHGGAFCPQRPPVPARPPARAYEAPQPPTRPIPYDDGVQYVAEPLMDGSAYHVRGYRRQA